MYNIVYASFHYGKDPPAINPAKGPRNRCSELQIMWLQDESCKTKSICVNVCLLCEWTFFYSLLCVFLLAGGLRAHPTCQLEDSKVSWVESKSPAKVSVWKPSTIQGQWPNTTACQYECHKLNQNKNHHKSFLQTAIIYIYIYKPQTGSNRCWCQGHELLERTWNPTLPTPSECQPDHIIAKEELDNSSHNLLSEVRFGNLSPWWEIWKHPKKHLTPPRWNNHLPTTIVQGFFLPKKSSRAKLPRVVKNKSVKDKENQ